ncbi:MAG: GNAT family N-acetyltransferase [Lutisporaceae bacterium]
MYRPMHLSDVDEVWTFLEAIKEENSQVSLVEIPDKEELKNWLENEILFLYIAECTSKVTGLLRATRGSELYKRHSVNLSIAVHPEYRSQGIAKELTNTALEDMKKDGITIARAYIYSDNLPSINTVLRLGFTFTGSVFMHHYNTNTNQNVDDLIFHKIL